ncbi:hypothetical protein NPIL_179851 [Nephila pilipes]|uniref:Uncharacterized protein n=1 Tax=Nephila pilipes TaxID=299642 RepID=A0A8X6TCT5_NEPPI|nr:hypothetical protein NPIL_179851 [Nephila pilipes]
MRKICVKLVPKVLTPDVKDIRVAISQDRLDRRLDRVRVKPRFLKRVIAGDKSWASLFQSDCGLGYKLIPNLKLQAAHGDLFN